jgi:hypothetical protein
MQPSGNCNLRVRPGIFLRGERQSERLKQGIMAIVDAAIAKLGR